MATCEQHHAFTSLDLPEEFEDLEGLVAADLSAIVTMLATRANERLLLTPREQARLQASLWKNLSAAVREGVRPLSAESR